MATIQERAVAMAKEAHDWSADAVSQCETGNRIDALDSIDICLRKLGQLRDVLVSTLPKREVS